MEKNKKMETYELHDDKRVLENKTLQTQRTFVGLGTEKKRSMRNW